MLDDLHAYAPFTSLPTPSSSQTFAKRATSSEESGSDSEPSRNAEEMKFRSLKAIYLDVGRDKGAFETMRRTLERYAGLPAVKDFSRSARKYFCSWERGW